MFQFWYDEGHGWLQVDAKLIRKLGVKVSAYSYYDVDEDTAYLEEDCDMPAFNKAYIARHGTSPEVTEHYVEGHAWIRDLGRWVW